MALVEGQATLLLKQIALRFGPLSEQARARVLSAEPNELDRWGEKVLSASTLDELFGG